MRGTAPPTAPGLASRAFAVLCAVSFFSHFTAAPFATLLPVYVDADVGARPLFTGYLRTLMFALGGVFAVVGGRLCDLFGLKPMLLVGLAGSIAAGLAFQSTDFRILTFFVILAGIAAGPMSAAGQSYLIASAGPERLGLGGALFFLTYTLGSSAGSLCTGLVKPLWSFGQIGAAMAAGATVVVLAAVLLLPDISGPASRGPQKLSLWRAYRPLLRQREVHLLVGMRLGITSFWGMAILVLPLLVFRVSGSAAVAAWYGAVSLAAAAVCQVAAGWLRDRYGRTRPLLVSAAGIAACALCLGAWSDSLTGLFLFGTGLAATAWAVSVLVPGLIDEVAPAAQKNRLVGLGHLAWSAAMALGGLAGGLLVEIDTGLPFFTGAAFSLAGTACLYGLCRRLDRKLHPAAA